jgi:hypothetical protein
MALPKTKALDRAVCFVTSCDQKIPEFKRHLDRYGVVTLQETDCTLSIEQIVSKHKSMYNVISVISETSILVKRDTDVVSTLKNLELVDHLSILTVFHVIGGVPVKDGIVVKNGIVTKTESKTVYTYRTPGYIDRTKDHIQSKFGWDNIFHLGKSHMSYLELDKFNIKISSRDMTFCKYIKDRLYYKEGINLVHDPQIHKRPVDFNTDGMHKMYVKMVEENPILHELGITGVVDHVFKNGIYYTSPLNRRVKLNWQPGVNGIPYTPKKEDVWHERTYGIHDDGHCAFKPDLITTIHSRLHYLLYIINRMMSEAMTIIFADMFFAHGIRDKYTTLSKRQIYPLFRDLNLPVDSDSLVNSVYKTMEANVFYCLLGDDSYYKKLLENKPTHNLEAFKEKYSEFFIQDYRWTKNNYDELTKQSDIQTKWYDSIGELNKKFDLGLVSTEEFRIKMNLIDSDTDDVTNLIRRIFEYIFEHNVKKFFLKDNITETIRPNNMAKAFVRYMCNQVYIFEKFSFVPSARSYKEAIMTELINIDESTFDMNDANRIRSFYEEFLSECLTMNLITPDDFETFKELYSIIDPFIVDYDTKFADSLETVAKNILGL